MKVKSFASTVAVVSLILFFMAPVLSFSQDDWYYNKPIKDIVFSGLKNIQASELEALMNPYKGQSFNDIIFWEILGKLYALEYFENIETNTVRANPEGSEVIIRFTVVERPIVRRINFVGNSGVRRHELNEAIFTKIGDIYNQARLRSDIEAINQKYIEKGYPNASVTIEENIAQDGITINFRITENEKISIIRIDFQGNSRFTANTLRSQISLKARTLVNDGAFQETKLIADRAAITKYYHDRGYIDAAVRDVTRTYGSDDKGTNLILTFLIEEGEEFRFGGITFEGNEIFSTERLDKLVTSKVGDVVNTTKIEMDLQRVADLYFENGYIFNSMNRVADKNLQTNTLSYTFYITERSRAYIEHLVIVGNEKTKTEVILREIPLEPGDVFSKEKVMDAMRNLYNLQYFSMIIPDTLQGSSENLMDLVFTVEEQMTTTIQLGITFSGSADPETFPISGMFEWTDKNIAGSGNELGISLNSTVVDSFDLSVNYLHRWVFGLPLSLGADLSASYKKRLATTDNNYRWTGEVNEPYAFPDGFSSWEEFRAYGNPAREYLMNYDQWYISVGLSTGYRWRVPPLGNIGVNGGLRIGWIYNSYDDILRPFDPTLRARKDNWTPRNIFWLAFSLDQRDIFYDPSRGYYFNQRASLNGFFNEEVEHYVRTDSKFQIFHTLFDFPVKWTDSWSFKCVVAFHAGLSFILPQPWRGTDTTQIPIEDASKLAIDGMFTGRGWGNDEYRKKGLLLLDSWVELRFPVVRGILAFDLFFDMAGVERKEGYYFGNDDEGNSNFTLNNLRFSYGGGLRFTIPQFPIRLSLAKRFKFVDNKFEWQHGALFGGDWNNPSEAWMGMDLVISFAMSY
ncbi:MAG: outer membrane protein assembly factor BamA [Treponema sp.]|jgi:outer membrane protein insertion porin family|nr:outer membrane protein assembly factor BamA [Treponema sp.]